MVAMSDDYLRYLPVMNGLSYFFNHFSSFLREITYCNLRLVLSDVITHRDLGEIFALYDYITHKSLMSMRNFARKKTKNGELVKLPCAHFSWVLVTEKFYNHIFTASKIFQIF